MQRTRLRGPRTALTARTLSLVTLVAVGGPAAADVIFQADASANVGYSRTRPDDVHRTYAEVRPALMLQLASPRVVWRTGYLFVGALDLGGDYAGSYSNQLTLSLAAELSPPSALVVSGSVMQGRPEFHLTQRPAEAGEPAFRSRANPALVTASLSEGYMRELSQRVRLGQGLATTASSPCRAPRS